MMNQETVIDIAQQSIYTLIIVASPILLTALTVGLLVSIFQAVTSIQEQTLAFVPKIIAVFLALLIFGPFIITTVQEFIIELFKMIPTLVVPM